MATCEQTWNRLKGQVPLLDPSAAPQFVNSALQDIYQEMDWSFLIARCSLVVPNEVSTGTVAVLNNQATVTFDATAQAILDVLSNPVITFRQFRVGDGIYSITAYSAGIATLDRAYEGIDDPTASYSILRIYYTPPSADFQKWITVSDPVNQYKFHTHISQAQLDMIDPNRTTGNQPFVLADYIEDSNGLPQYEMWPHPTSSLVLRCMYKRRGIDLEDDDNLPTALSIEMVLQKAKYLVYEWCEANKGDHPTLQKSNWLTLMAAAQKQYLEMLRSDKRADREVYNSRIMTDNFPFFSFPFDTDYMQSHDVYSLAHGYRGLL